MKNEFENSFDYKVIYIFTIHDKAHKNMLKIGDATLHTNTSIDKLNPNCHELKQAALNRIRSYTNTAGLTPELLHAELAIKTIKNKDGSSSIKAFRDYEVHNVLRNSNIENKTIGNSTGREWFEIDLETAKKAIDAVKNGFSNLSNRPLNKIIYYYYKSGG